jgi:hypothetical protein
MFAFAFLRNIFEHEGQFYSLRNPLSSNKIIRGSRQQNVTWIGASEIFQKYVLSSIMPIFVSTWKNIEA